MTVMPKQKILKAKNLILDHFDKKNSKYYHGWSDKLVAELCGVGISTVGVLRRRLFGRVRPNVGYKTNFNRLVAFRKLIDITDAYGRYLDKSVTDSIIANEFGTTPGAIHGYRNRYIEHRLKLPAILSSAERLLKPRNGDATVIPRLPQEEEHKENIVSVMADLIALKDLLGGLTARAKEIVVTLDRLEA
jgi:hypothetical protein